MDRPMTTKERVQDSLKWRASTHRTMLRVGDDEAALIAISDFMGELIDKLQESKVLTPEQIDNLMQGLP